MATPNAAANADEMSLQSDLENEVRQAERDFACGDFVDVTVEELDRCIAAGKWPWPTESSE